MMGNSLGKRIRSFRILRGMTQEQLAELCFVSPSCVSRWEAGSISPSAKNQAQIAKALDIRIDDLYISPELELPPDVVTREILDSLSSLNDRERRYILEQLRLFQSFKNSE